VTTFGRKIVISFESKATGATITPDGEHLNIGFTVERNLDIEPSTLLATIHNLSSDTQEKLKDTDAGWVVTLVAGYGDDAGVIFKGDVRQVRHRREPPLLATDIEAEDGGKASKVTVNRHFPKGTTVGTVFKWMQEQSGLGTGNVTRITQINKPDGLPDRLKNGMTVRGLVMEEMGDLAKSRGAVLSSQNGEVVVLQHGEALPGASQTEISPSTGLIGYPYVDNEGVLTLNHRLNPNIVPGAPIVVDAQYVKGRYVVERAVYSGSLWNSDFNVEIEGRAAI
jgi:hypothetical protein